MHVIVNLCVIDRERESKLKPKVNIKKQIMIN